MNGTNITHNIQTSSFIFFRANFIKSIRSIPDSILDTFNPLIIKLITRINLELSRLDECKFNNTFNNCINPLSKCSLDTYSKNQFFYHRSCYNSARISLLYNLTFVDRALLNLSGLSLVTPMFFCIADSLMNLKILNSYFNMY